LLFTTDEKQPEEKGKATPDDNQEKHIMISYQWDAQRRVVKIKDGLRKLGYRVWLDVEQMHGSTMEAMANAVESSACVVTCISQKYKNSPNCRAEAEYTFNLRRSMIPLMMDKNYKPDGWLGFLLGSKLYGDATDPEQIDEVVNFLDTQLKKLIVPSQLQSQPVTHVESKKCEFLDWVPEKVQSWLQENKLSDYKEKFQTEKVTGHTLDWLKRKSQKNEANFHSLMLQMFQFKLGDLALFDDALSKL